ncbi:SRPBCC family protein, partial [Streptomyces nigra]
MSTVKETVDVEVPLRRAYDQWTQFEDFPRFMEGVEEVRQLDERHNHWVTSIGGVRREFDTEIVDQLADDRITWRSVSGDTKQCQVSRSGAFYQCLARAAATWVSTCWSTWLP